MTAAIQRCRPHADVQHRREHRRDFHTKGSTPMPIRLTDEQLEGSIDALKMTDEAWISLVKKLDEQAGDNAFTSKRGFERMTYCDMLVAICEVEHPGGNRARFTIRTRDLSASGIGFFHGQYLYPGSRCAVLLMAQDTGMTRLQGTVRRCHLVQGRAHIIGIAFDELIEPERFTGRVAPNPPAAIF